jgi:hypothetical protein
MTEWQSAGTSEPRDQKRDLFDGCWAEVGPDTPGRYGYPQPWSWNILTTDRGSVDAGVEASVFEARQAVQDWIDAAAPDPDAPPLPAPGSSDRRVAIIEDLNAYQASSGQFDDSIWEDVILRLPEYDGAATRSVNLPWGAQFVLTDGTVIHFNAQRGRWEVQL